MAKIVETQEPIRTANPAFRFQEQYLDEFQKQYGQDPLAVGMFFILFDGSAYYVPRVFQRVFEEVTPYKSIMPPILKEAVDTLHASKYEVVIVEVDRNAKPVRAAEYRLGSDTTSLAYTDLRKIDEPKATDLATTGNEESGLVSQNKQRQFLREAEKMLTAGIAFGYMKEFFIAGGLHNIKNQKLHLASGLSWKQYLDQNKIAERTARRYVRAAEMMQELLIEQGLAKRDDPNFSFTQKLIGQGFEHYHAAKTNNITVHGLGNAARDLETFKLYLNGSENIDEKFVQKLLKPAEEVAASKQEEDQRKDLIANVQRHERNSAMTAIAARKGLRWNGKTFVKEDGTELTEEEWSVFATAADLFLIWTELQSDLAKMMHEVMQKIEKYAPMYVAYRDKAEPGDTKEINERLRTAKMQIKTISNMIGTIHEGSIEDVREIYKAGPSHH